MIAKVITFALSSFIAMTLGLWVSDRDPPVITYNKEVITPTVAPGGDLIVRYSVRRFRSCYAHIDRSLFDSEKTRFELPDLDFMNAPGPLGDDTYRTSTPIPSKMANGPASLNLIVTYQCNPLHKLWPVVVTSSSISFLVDGSKSDLPLIINGAP